MGILFFFGIDGFYVLSSVCRVVGCWGVSEYVCMCVLELSLVLGKWSC